MKSKSICCFHLLNDYSGSPQVLSIVLNMMIDMGYNVRLNTSDTSGFLSGITNADKDKTLYRWTGKGFAQIILLLSAQVQIFFQSLFFYRKYDIFYINTVLPFGAALAGKMSKKKIIYHIHEKYINPNIMQRFAYWVMKHTATHVIFVSNYLLIQCADLVKNNYCVVFNCLSKEFEMIADNYLKRKINKPESLKNVLMICSFKEYKGIIQFALLAKKLPNFNFHLVVNSELDEMVSFRENFSSTNLFVYPTQIDVHKFYQNAHLLVNLSIPRLWIETFGLTLLEGMRYGLPVIAPPVGGPIEIVQDGINGFCINSENIDLLEEKILKILNNKELYEVFSNASIQKSRMFEYDIMYKKVETILENI
ncbi:MAG: glycosyltransferase family 4 protein [Streptococcaceae bacterium]|jgi:glycosyltransferase involved in cell wall biosynthesis|nr:glycosyltransferase family 4 protein [Streptococcaceae bacterium]